MPSVQWGAATTARLVFTPLGSALGALSNGAGTIALLWRPVIFSTARCDGAALASSALTTPYMGLSLGDTGTGQWSADDGVAWILSSSTPAFGDWYISVVDWPAVSGKARFHWSDLTTAAGWVHQDSVGNNQNAKAGPGSTGKWIVGNFDGGVGSGAQFALVAAWNVRLGDTNAALLSAGLRTSDWAKNPAGAPIFLSEITSLTPSDLIGATTFSAASSTTTNLTVGGNPAGGWTFDGLGADTPIGGAVIFGARKADATTRRDAPTGALILAGSVVEFHVTVAVPSETPAGSLVLAGRVLDKRTGPTSSADRPAGALTFSGRLLDRWTGPTSQRARSELFANNFATQLTIGCAPTDDVIYVASPAPDALQGGQFRVLLNQEYMLVVGGQDTNEWNVIRGADTGESPAPDPGTHFAGTWVTHLWTAAAINLVTGALATGFLADLGDVGTTATLNAAIARTFTCVLTAPVCQFSVINATPGSLLDVVPFQDGSPPRMIEHPAVVAWTSTGTPTLSSNANAPDRFNYLVLAVDGFGDPTRIVGSLGFTSGAPPTPIDPPVIT